MHTVDSGFSSISPSPRDEEREVRCTLVKRLILLHDEFLLRRFLIFLVATVAASDQRRIDDGEWAEVNIGAAIGHFHFELKRGANWTV